MKKSYLALLLLFVMAAPCVALEVSLKDTDVRLQVYGYIRADLAHDTQATAPKGDFAFFVLPEVDGKKDGQTHIGARESRLGLNILGPEKGAWKASGKLEMDFYGGEKANSYNPRMRLAYLDLAHSCGFAFRIGQDWETFIEVVPRIVNFGYLADGGALGLRRPQARLTQEVKFSERTKFIAKVAVAQTVGEDLDGGTFEDGADSDLPTVQASVAFLQKWWTEKLFKIALGGHFGRETLDKTEEGVIVESDVKDFDTWSAQLSVFLPLTKCLALQGNVWQGANLDTYFGGIGQGVNVAKDCEIEAQGGWAQILFDPTEKLSFGLGVALDDPDDENLATGRPSKNEQIFVNVAYKFTTEVTGLAEFAHMTTDYLDKDDATNERFQIAMKYSF